MGGLDRIGGGGAAAAGTGMQGSVASACFPVGAARGGSGPVDRCRLPAARKACARGCYCMNQPWLATTDWPVRAFEGKAAITQASSAISSTVVNV